MFYHKKYTYRNPIFAIFCLFLWPLYSADKLKIENEDQSKFVIIPKLPKTKNIPHDMQLNLHKIKPICLGTILYLRGAIQLTLIDFYNYKISAETAKNDLQRYQLTTEATKKLCNNNINNNQSYIKIWVELSDIISHWINCIEELSEKNEYLFSRYLENNDYILAVQLLEKEKNKFLLKKNYEKCQQSLQSYLKNIQSNSYFNHTLANIKKYLFLLISLLNAYIITKHNSV